MHYIVLTSVFVIVVLYAYRRFMEIVESVAHIPGPKAFPFLGNAMMFFGRTSADMLEFAPTMIKEHGTFIRILLGPKILILMGEPEDVEALLTNQKTIEKSEEYDYAKVWIGEGLITSTGPKWHSRRKIITPGFHFNILQSFVRVFDGNSQILVDKLAKAENNVDIYALTLLCALDNICGEIRLQKLCVIAKMKLTRDSCRSCNGHENKCPIELRFDVRKSCRRVSKN